MLILGLLGMYFDAVVVFVTSQTLLFRLALAILCFAPQFFMLISDSLGDVQGFLYACNLLDVDFFTDLICNFCNLIGAWKTKNTKIGMIFA
jgi:hypothetical protein